MNKATKYSARLSAIVAVLILAPAFAAAAPVTLYVRQGATGGNGTISNPYGTLAEAVNQVMTGATTYSLDTMTPAGWDLFRAAVAWADNVVLPVSNRPAALIVANTNIYNTNNLDLLMLRKLESYGYVVEIVQHTAWSTWAPANAASKDLIVISESVSSGNVINPHNVATPVVNCEGGLVDEWLWGNGANMTGNQFTIVNASHPLAAGRTGTFAVYQNPGVTLATMANTSVPAAQIVARPVDDPATPINEGNYIALMGIDQGVLLADGTTVNAARRVHIAYHSNGGQFPIVYNNPPAVINMTGGNYDHTAQVRVPTNIQIFGGWSNNFSTRNPAVNITSLQSATTGILRADRSSSGPFTLDGLTFTANMGSANGGAVWGAIFVGPVTINNCRFTGCIARQEPALYLSEIPTTFTVTDVTIENCRQDVTTAGDDIAYMQYMRGNTVIRNLVFRNNQSNAFGWRMRYFPTGSTLIENCRFQFNNIHPASTNTGGAPCMTIFDADSNAAPVTIRNCDFSSNTALNAAAGTDRGAIHINNCAGTILFENCTFTSNSVNDDGSCLQTGNCAATTNLTFRNCLFANNRSGVRDDGPGALAFSDPHGYITVENCVFDSNVAGPDLGQPSNPRPDGAAIRTDGNDGIVLIKNCVFRNNRSPDNGAAIRILNRNATPPNGRQHIIDGCWFENNTARNQAVIVDDDATTRPEMDIVKNCVFINNTTGADSIIRLNGRNGGIYNCTFYGNRVTPDTSSRIVFTAGNTSSTLKAVVNCIFMDNTTADARGRNVIIEANNNASPWTKVENNLFFGSGTTPQFPGYMGSNTTTITLQGRLTGNGNFSQDPLFVNAAGGNLRLQGSSPAIDAGQASPANEDILGVPRPQGTSYDIGAYEYLVIPSPPTNLTASPGDRSVRCQWTGVPYAMSYRVYYSTSQTGPWTLGKEVLASELQAIVTGLTNGTPYYFVVRAVNILGESGNSNVATATPNAQISLGMEHWELYH